MPRNTDDAFSPAPADPALDVAIPAAPAIGGSRTFEEHEALARQHAQREADKRQREQADAVEADRKAAERKGR
jgi:hypothetical protein